MIANVFTVPRLCVLTGDIKPLASLKATPRETQLYASSKAERTKIVLSEDYNHIHIPSQEASDRSKAVAGRAINHI